MRNAGKSTTIATVKELIEVSQDNIQGGTNKLLYIMNQDFASGLLEKWKNKLKRPINFSVHIRPDHLNSVFLSEKQNDSGFDQDPEIQSPFAVPLHWAT
jgi:hypothetical protein